MRHRRGSFGLVLPALALAFASACAEQREGERCDKQSGNDDCEQGLICTTQSSSSSSGSGDQSAQGELLPAVCCPPQGQHATAQICTAGGITTPEEPDAGTGGASGAAGRDAASDAAGAGGASGAAGEGGGGREAGQGGSAGAEAGAGGSMDAGGGANPDASVKDGG